MAIESKRGCGYRKVGGTYLVGGYISIPCDRLPLPLQSCPVCGAGIHFTRSIIEINPLKLFGTHDKQVSVFSGEGTVTQINCFDKFRPCFMCDPTNEPAFIMMVGEKFYPTPEHFMEEAKLQGVSKRIPFIPKNLKLGKSVLYLAHNKACIVREPAVVQQAMSILEQSQPKSPPLIEDTQRHHLGIFSAFIPQRIEKIFWQSELDKMDDREKESLNKRGITPIGIPDGDNDHAPRG